LSKGTPPVAAPPAVVVGGAAFGISVADGVDALGETVFEAGVTGAAATADDGDGLGGVPVAGNPNDGPLNVGDDAAAPVVAVEGAGALTVLDDGVGVDVVGLAPSDGDGDPVAGPRTIFVSGVLSTASSAVGLTFVEG
jgi:hypothetical protein